MKVFIVCVSPVGLNFNIVGVFSTIKAAVEACRTADYFVVPPVQVDQAMPIHVPDCWWPRSGSMMPAAFVI